MLRSYQNFEHYDYDEEYCFECPNLKRTTEYDEGGPEVAGGMQPQTVRVYECRWNSPRAHSSKCRILESGVAHE